MLSLASKRANNIAMCFFPSHSATSLSIQATKTARLKLSMAQNFSGSGFNYDNTCKTYSTFGKKI